MKLIWYPFYGGPVHGKGYEFDALDSPPPTFHIPVPVEFVRYGGDGPSWVEHTYDLEYDRYGEPWAYIWRQL